MTQQMSTTTNVSLRFY